MKVGIYNDASRAGNVFDGSDRLALSLAQVLAAPEGGSHAVEFVHHKQDLRRERLDRFYGPGLESVALRYVPVQPWQATSPLRIRERRRWHADLSEPYDLFVNVVHEAPPFCHAPRGVLLVLFPFHDASGLWDASPMLQDLAPSRRAARAARRFEWGARMNSYALKLSISRFVQDWTRRRWGVESQVLYPPADVPPEPLGEEEARDRDDVVLSVGRFAAGGVLKRQLEMAHAWNLLHETPTLGASMPAGWKYICAGAGGAGADEAAYLENVRAVAQAGAGACEVAANVEWARLQEAYRRAKIFWHGAGWGVDEARRPQEVEHFGIVTVEAMAAGCVPVVANRGGQSEIVEHGVNGFLWETLGELQSYTALLARSEALRMSMARAARERARAFGRDAFAASFLAQAAPLLAPRK